MKLAARTCWACAVLVMAVFGGSCGVLSHLEDICNCHPLPDETDYRHAAKHVPIPGGTPALITVNDILSWAQTPILPPTQPRFGRELQLVQIQLAYLENASVNPSDCDVHLEISQTPDLHAPRVIIETPIDHEYCANRQYVQSYLQQQGFQLDVSHGGDLARPLAVSVLGLSRTLNIRSSVEPRKLLLCGRFIRQPSRSVDMKIARVP